MRESPTDFSPWSGYFSPTSTESSSLWGAAPTSSSNSTSLSRNSSISSDPWSGVSGFGSKFEFFDLVVVRFLSMRAAEMSGPPHFAIQAQWRIFKTQSKSNYGSKSLGSWNPTPNKVQKINKIRLFSDENYTIFHLLNPNAVLILIL